jgi:hypothetical protein
MNENVRGPDLSILGYQNQWNIAQTKSKHPITKNGTLHPPALVMTATKGMPTTDDKEATAIRIPKAFALFSGGRTSATAAMLLGGIMPPDRPVRIRNPRRAPKLGAKLDATTLADNNVRPATDTGRLPNESDIGPTEITEIAQAANVTAANCPAAATETSNSSDNSTNSGASMSPTSWARNIATPVIARNRVCLTFEGLVIVAK